MDYLITNSDGSILHLYKNVHTEPNIPEGCIASELPEDAEFNLPEEWYYNGQRPQWVTLTDINEFTVVPGKYHEIKAFELSTEFDVNDKLVATVSMIDQVHTLIEKAGDLEGLEPDDIAAISETLVGKKIDTEFTGTAKLAFNGKIYDLSFTAGVCNLPDLDYSGLEGEASAAAAIQHETYPHVAYIDLSSMPEDIIKMAALRKTRDALINSTDWLVIRHQDQSADTNCATPDLTSEEFQSLLDYRRELRDLPDNAPDLNNISWPEAPSFI